MKTTRKLMIAAVAAAALMQSAATFADPPSGPNGNCTPMPTWVNGWLPCFTVQGGNSSARNGK